MKTTSKKSVVFSFIGIVSDVLLIVAFFVKWFRYTATYQPQTPGGAVSSVDYYFSMAENLKAEDAFFMFWLVLSLIAASIVCFCADIIKKENRTIKIISRVVFAVAAAGFFVAFAIAAGVGRGF